MLERGPVRVVGTMSGTSLDGVDAAEIVTDGHAILEFSVSSYRAYSAEEQQTLRGALGQWPGAGNAVAAASGIVDNAHAELLAGFARAELIGFHGQTLAHDPAGCRTHQTGDGAALADRIGRPVAWDFRTHDMSLGGQGAPLAPFYHFALARHMNADQPLAFVNLGGVGNLTWLDPRQPGPEAPGALLAFDTGPANAPVNDLMYARLGLDCDRDGRLAAAGRVDARIVSNFLTDPYFQQVPPKSLDRDDYAALIGAVASLGDADAAATLTACSAASIGHALDHCPVPPAEILLCGGGRHNATMCKLIADACPMPVRPVEAYGFDGDMLEAQAFAFLAVRALRGLPISAPGTTGVRMAVTGGRVSVPR